MSPDNGLKVPGHFAASRRFIVLVFVLALAFLVALICGAFFVFAGHLPGCDNPRSSPTAPVLMATKPLQTHTHSMRIGAESKKMLRRASISSKVKTGVDLSILLADNPYGVVGYFGWFAFYDSTMFQAPCTIVNWGDSTFRQNIASTDGFLEIKTMGIGNNFFWEAYKGAPTDTLEGQYGFVGECMQYFVQFCRGLFSYANTIDPYNKDEYDNIYRVPGRGRFLTSSGINAAHLFPETNFKNNKAYALYDWGPDSTCPGCWNGHLLPDSLITTQMRKQIDNHK